MSEPEQAIRERAYALWEKEGSPPGRDQEFWERARLMIDAESAPPLQTTTSAYTAEDEALADTFPASDPPSTSATTEAVKRSPGRVKRR